MRQLKAICTIVFVIGYLSLFISFIYIAAKVMGGPIANSEAFTKVFNIAMILFPLSVVIYFLLEAYKNKLILKEWEKIERTGSIKALKEFYKKHPDYTKSEIAKEITKHENEQALKNALQENTIEGFKAFFFNHGRIIYTKDKFHEVLTQLEGITKINFMIGALIYRPLLFNDESTDILLENLTDAPEQIIDALKDKVILVRAKAAYILGRIKDIRAIEPLIDALGDKDYEVRKNAEEALKNIVGPIDVAPQRWRIWWEKNKETYLKGR